MRTTTKSMVSCLLAIRSTIDMYSGRIHIETRLQMTIWSWWWALKGIYTSCLSFTSKHNPTHKLGGHNRRECAAWVFYASTKLYDFLDYVYGNFRTTIMCSRNRPESLHEEMEETKKDEEAKEQHTDSHEYHCAHLCLFSLPDAK